MYGQEVDAAPPGVLHSFIKKVKAFSVCFDHRPGPSGGLPTSEDPAAANPSTGPLRGPAASAATAATAAAALPRRGDAQEGNPDDNADRFGDYGEGAPFSPDAESAPNGRTTAHDHTPTTTPAKGGAGSSREGGQGGGGGASRAGESGQTGGQANAPLRVSHPIGGGQGSEGLRRAKARLQGKRKLAYPSPQSARGNRAATEAPRRDDEGDGGAGNGDGDRRGGGGGGRRERGGAGRGKGALESNAARKSGRAKKSLAGAGGGAGETSRRRGGTGGGRGEARGQSGSGAGGDGGGGAGWLSLSWSSARRLRERMESSAAQVS